ncbi:MAG: dynamin family protein [Pseudomonadota bacterium]
MKLYRENYINAVHGELLDLVEKHLTPVAIRYGYSQAPLESNIKWRPLVLVLGNYSSGKSALINEFLEAEIQKTGQAPTDDSFTILTYDPRPEPGEVIRVTEERDGKFLLNDPEFPFESLKKHGQRFNAHFRLKKVNSPFLKSLAIIDTPGMLDSVTERDRGYDYQDVIGDLAQIADLILVLFDPHKAGTIREAHTSLRDTLPTRTFEDRVLFVLNRIDECGSLSDLLRVYGTLCWNLSQITGRKDIPMIHLTYSPRAAQDSKKRLERDTSYLQYLENQREELKKAVMEAPRHRLDHLATFVETHSERMSHLLEGLINYRQRLFVFRLKQILYGAFCSVVGAVAIVYAGVTLGTLGNMDIRTLLSAGVIGTVILLLLWILLIMPFTTRRFFRKQIKNLNSLTSLENQTRRDNWETIRELVSQYLNKTGGKYSSRKVQRDHEAVLAVSEKGSREIREALHELAALKPGVPVTDPPGPFLSALTQELKENNNR